MVHLSHQLPLAAALLNRAPGVNGASDTAAGPAWVESEYSSSPPIYPSPNATGLDWRAAFQRASGFVNQLTLDEKAYLVTGTLGPCTGNIAPIPRLGFQGLCLQDGPLAIREADYASVFPAGLTVAASWDRDAAHLRGQQMAMEFKGKGAHVILGPVAGPLGRSGYGGRNWEGFSPDPYLTGEMFQTTIEGIQETGVQACAKHYIGNEQETLRNPEENEDGDIIEAVSSNIDDQTMHEVYAWPFQNAIKAHAASIMSSYQRINGSYGCQNSKTLNGILKDEYGFQGYVVSDWGATHSGYQAAQSGEDMDMPGSINWDGGASFFGKNITTNVNNGSLPVERLDDMCRRIMMPYFQFQQTTYAPIDGSEPGISDSPISDYNYTFNLGPSDVDVRGDHAQSIRNLGADGIVLLKNTNNALPLTTPMNIGIFGNDAGDLTRGLYFGSDPDLYDIGFEYGVLPVGGGSGTGRFTYVVPPLDAVKAKVASYDVNHSALVQYVLNNTLVIEAEGFNILYPRPPEVCLVFLKTWATEGYDRGSLLVDWDGTELVDTVASQCSNTIVITHSGGLNVMPFANHPNVTAILAAHLPGQEVGNSIVDVLWGDVNPSGHLPYTIARQEDDYAFADITNSTELLDTSDPNAWQSDFKERLLVDYRWFDYFNESVQYEFGYGLSYTTFTMSDLSVEPSSSSSISSTPAPQAIAPGGNPAVWEILYTVTATVTNAGYVGGAAVPQLYLGLPQPLNSDFLPKKALRGFDKVMLQPGESSNVAFELTRRDISYWDVVSQQWTIAPGPISVMAGFSSRDIRGTTSFSAVE